MSIEVAVPKSPQASPQTGRMKVKRTSSRTTSTQQEDFEFQRVLIDPPRRSMFRTFLTKTNKENCLLFWVAVDHARITVAEERFADFVTHHWNLYVANNEPNNVAQFLHLDNMYQLKNVINSGIPWKASLVDPVMAELYQLLRQEFVRFCETREYKRMSQEIRDSAQKLTDMQRIVEDVFIRRAFRDYLKSPSRSIPNSDSHALSAVLSARSTLQTDIPNRHKSSDDKVLGNFYHDYMAPDARLRVDTVKPLLTYNRIESMNDLTDIEQILMKHLEAEHLDGFLQSPEFKQVTSNAQRSNSEVRRKSSGLLRRIFSRFKNSHEERAGQDPPPDAKRSYNENEVLNPTRFEELPKEMQNIIKKAGITPEDCNRHFLVALNILHFKEKVSFKLIEDQKEVNIALERQSSFIKLPLTTNKRPSDLARELTEDIKKMQNESTGSTRYQKLQEVGRGGFGKIFRGVHLSSDTVVAIKEVPHGSSKSLRTNVNEIAMLKFCNHANVLRLMDLSVAGDNLWMITEFMEGGSLYSLARSNCLHERHIAFISREVLKGIAYLHSENLIHRDLKSANLMLTAQAVIKIIDFGLCIDLTEKLGVAMVGSPYWMSPEMIRREPYDFKTDIYSFGVTLMELANGRPPGSKSSIQCMFITATQGWRKPLDKPKNWTAEFQDFLQQTLTLDPRDRPSAEQLLNHNFLNSAVSREQMHEFTQGLFLIRSLGVL